MIRGLCGQKRYLKPATLAAITTLSLRPMVAADFSNRLLSLFILHVLSVPGFLLHILQIAPEVFYFYFSTERT